MQISVTLTLRKASLSCCFYKLKMKLLFSSIKVCFILYTLLIILLANMLNPGHTTTEIYFNLDTFLYEPKHSYITFSIRIVIIQTLTVS